MDIGRDVCVSRFAQRAGNLRLHTLLQVSGPPGNSYCLSPRVFLVHKTRFAHVHQINWDKLS